MFGRATDSAWLLALPFTTQVFTFAVVALHDAVACVVWSLSSLSSLLRVVATKSAFGLSLRVNTVAGLEGLEVFVALQQVQVFSSVQDVDYLFILISGLQVG